MTDEPIRITFRIPTAVHAEIKALAEKEDRSLNGQTVALIRAGLQSARTNENAPLAGTGEALDAAKPV